MTRHPVINPESEPFWAACAQGRLTLQRCTKCGLRFFFPRTRCPACSSTEVAWIDATGRGVVYSYSVVWRRSVPEVETPYVLALVDLEEGVRLMTHVIVDDHASLRVGMPVVVDFSAPIGDLPTPRFRPA